MKTKTLRQLISGGVHFQPSWCKPLNVPLVRLPGFVAVSAEKATNELRWRRKRERQNRRKGRA